MEREVGAKVVNGEIVVVDGMNDEIITVRALKNVDLFINNIKCESFKSYEVTSRDKIKCTCEKKEGSKTADVVISKDKMKAFIVVEYTPEIEYKPKDKDTALNLVISAEIAGENELEHFTNYEIKKILKEKGIVYGIKEEKIIEALDRNGEEILIAEGKAPIDDIPSEVKLFFTPTQMIFPDPDSNTNIDYKNLFRISNVNAGDKIAEIIPEITGEDGLNILGQVVERKYVRSMPINATEGCTIDGNDIIALIDGKAHISNNNVSVNPVFSVESVNMETCNIKFCGDIEVYDSVQDNMFVSAGGSLDVSQNVTAANVVTGGEVTILGNAINSKILSGQIDIRKKEYSDVLKEFKFMINGMIEYMSELNMRRVAIKNDNLIRLLTEKNFPNFQKVALNIVSLNIKNKTKRNKLVRFIKENVLGYNILNLKSIEDLMAVLKILDNEIDYYDKNIIVPLDIRIGYCQDCEIKSTGNIILGGRGEYTSKLTAMKDIIFTNSNAVARGGTLSAGGRISLGIVGSKAYIPTTLMVPEDGKISAVLAYRNTIFCFGKTKMILEEDMRNINVFYNKDERSIIFKSASS